MAYEIEGTERFVGPNYGQGAVVSVHYTWLENNGS